MFSGGTGWVWGLLLGRRFLTATTIVLVVLATLLAGVATRLGAGTRG